MSESRLPDGTSVGVYDDYGSLLREVAVDVETGRLAEPVEAGRLLLVYVPGQPMCEPIRTVSAVDRLGVDALRTMIVPPTLSV